MSDDKELKEFQALIEGNPGFELFLRENGFKGEVKNENLQELKAKYEKYMLDSNKEKRASLEAIAADPEKKKEFLGKIDGTFNIGSEDPKSAEANADDSAIAKWQKWAGEHNYIFEDAKEEGYDYSFKLYKNEEDLKNKEPATIIKCTGNNMYVKSDDLNVYREIIKQAQEKQYNAINFLESLGDSQKKMLMIACLEAGMQMKNAPLLLSIKDPLCEGLSDETKEKIKEHNYKTLSAAANEEIKKHQAAHKEEPLDLKEILGAKNVPAILGATLLYEAQQQKVEVKSNCFFDVPDNEFEVVPVQRQEALREAVKLHNKQYAQTVYDRDQAALIAQKEADPKLEIDIKGRGDPTAQAIAYAICVSKNIKIKEGSVPNNFDGARLDDLPEDVRKVINTKTKVEEKTAEVKEKLEDNTPTKPAKWRKNLKNKEERPITRNAAEGAKWRQNIAGKARS